ncbi:tetratricopeptide repeat protein [Chloroflexi bacterium TSY]|nr:tetratricopeptide repeat protein [Chloroflexi bacterium TSY]
MNHIYLSISITLFVGIMLLTGCGDSPGNLLADGNAAYAEEAYAEALLAYTAAQELAPTDAEPIYNIANTLYRQESFTETQQLMPQALGLAEGTVAQSGQYNLGNAHYQMEQWLAAVEAYKAALRLNPNDMDAKYNLELALRHLDQEQQTEQQQSSDDQQEQEQQEDDVPNDEQSDQSQEDPQEQESADQSQGKEEQEEESNTQNQSSDQQEQEEQAQSSDESDGSKDEQGVEQLTDQGQPQEQVVQPLTEEQARQLLSTIGRNAETLQERLQQIYVAPGDPPDKDW